MMIRTFPVENYRGANIYFRNMENHWEYLAVVDGQIYNCHMTVRARLLNRILFLLGIERTRFSKQQERGILATLRRLANSTVDFILDGQPEDTKEKA